MKEGDKNPPNETVKTVKTAAEKDKLALEKEEKVEESVNVFY